MSITYKPSFLSAAYQSFRIQHSTQSRTLLATCCSGWTVTPTRYIKVLTPSSPEYDWSNLETGPLKIQLMRFRWSHSGTRWALSSIQWRILQEEKYRHRHAERDRLPRDNGGWDWMEVKLEVPTVSGQGTRGGNRSWKRQGRTPSQSPRCECFCHHLDFGQPASSTVRCYIFVFDVTWLVVHFYSSPSKRINLWSETFK